MKRVLLILTLVGLLLSLAIPCYALDAVVTPTEEPTEAEEAGNTIVAEDDCAGTTRNPEADCRKMVSGLRDADQSDVERFFAEHPEELEEALISGDAMEKILATKATATWICTKDARGYGFYYYAQEESNTCSCACARMCLKGVARVNVTEREAVIGMQVVPGFISVTVEETIDYINQKQSVYSYDDKYSILKSLFNSNQLSAIKNGAPTIVGINVKKSGQWVYDDLVGEGHAICCYAIKSDKSAYMIADPWGGYSANGWNWYSRTSGELWNAYSSKLGYGA